MSMERRLVLLPLLSQWFTRPDDDIALKRQQCVVVGCGLIMFLSLAFNVLMGVYSGLFSEGGYISMVGAIIAFGVLLHCRITRRPTAVRWLYIDWLYFSFHYMIIRGGFRHIPQLAFAGLWAPIFSTFLCSSIQEPILWFSIWLVGSVGIWVAQLNNLLPAVTVDIIKLTTQNTIGLFCFGVYYFVTFLFVTHAYRTETKSRHTLQNEIQLFMRLSHEIRTPLTIISGMVELMKAWKDELNNEQQCILSDLGMATRRLYTVVNDLFTFSNDCDVTVGGSATNNNSSDGLSFDETCEFNLRDVIDTVIDHHLPHSEKSGLNIYVEMQSELPLEVTGRKDQLISVLDQLVSNAVKFTPSGSVTIHVRLEDESLDCVIGPSSRRASQPIDFHFEIRDTGVGIAPHELSSVFEPFVRLRSATSTTGYGGGADFEGLGLGLTLAMRLVRKWGRPNETIHCVSEGLDRGATFSFTIPLVVRWASSPGSCVGLLPLSTVLSPRAGTSVLLILDNDHPSAKSAVQLCSAIGIPTERAKLTDVSNDRFKLSLISNLVFWNMFGSLDGFLYGQFLQLALCAQSVVREVLAAIRSSSPDLVPPSAVLVAAPTAAKPWITQQLKCIHLRNPPAMRELSSAYFASSVQQQPPNASPVTPRAFNLPHQCMSPLLNSLAAVPANAAALHSAPLDTPAGLIAAGTGRFALGSESALASASSSSSSSATSTMRVIGRNASSSLGIADDGLRLASNDDNEAAVGGGGMDDGVQAHQRAEDEAAAAEEDFHHQSTERMYRTNLPAQPSSSSLGRGDGHPPSSHQQQNRDPTSANPNANPNRKKKPSTSTSASLQQLHPPHPPLPPSFPPSHSPAGPSVGTVPPIFSAIACSPQPNVATVSSPSPYSEAAAIVGRSYDAHLPRAAIVGLPSVHQQQIKKSILLVDDNPVILRLLTNFIEKAGFLGEVEAVESGETALIRIATADFSLIFMDFNMMGLNGAEVTMQIRQSGLDAVPIVGITAATNMREACLASGMNDVLFKPFTADRIQLLLKQYNLLPPPPPPPSR